VKGHQRRRALGSAAKDRVKLVVDDVDATAERCWDAGLKVRICGPADASTIVVIDPFGVEMELISNG
jgi:hypothetical protein